MTCASEPVCTTGVAGAVTAAGHVSTVEYSSVGEPEPYGLKPATPPVSVRRTTKERASMGTHAAVMVSRSALYVAW